MPKYENGNTVAEYNSMKNGVDGLISAINDRKPVYDNLSKIGLEQLLGTDEVFKRCVEIYDLLTPMMGALYGGD